MARTDKAPYMQHCLDLSTELMWVADRTSLVRVNTVFERTFGYQQLELHSRPWLDLVHPADREGVSATLRMPPTSEDAENRIEFEARFRCKDGSYRRIGWTAAEHDGLLYATGREPNNDRQGPDWSSEAQCLIRDSHLRIRALAEQQEALRRLATQVARGVSPHVVFATAAKEIAQCLKVCRAAVFRYDLQDTANAAVLVGTHASYTEFEVHQSPFTARLALDGDNLTTRVLRSGRPARMDSDDAATGMAAAHLRELGLRSAVGAPIVVDGRVWGLVVVGSPLPQAHAPDTEARIGDFADLVGIAIANAAARSDLLASRKRIVAAADNARRSFERDLHDGAQQQLVSLALRLRMAEGSVPQELADLKAQLSGAISELCGITHELRELSHGLHPAILSSGGLGPALKNLARRSTVPVVLELAAECRMPDPVEVAAYYIAAEALTNAAKHACASEVVMRVSVADDNLCLAIADDGIGGADCRNGSGLIGLIDRVEAVGGHIQIDSPPGRGTSLTVTLPLMPSGHEPYHTPHEPYHTPHEPYRTPHEPYPTPHEPYRTPSFR
jgi:PAS domain S-box-containing protein